MAEARKDKNISGWDIPEKVRLILSLKASHFTRKPFYK
jgi:hypothetical protein